MKKFTIALAAALLTMICVVALVGCGDSAVNEVRSERYLRYYNGVGDLRADIGDKLPLPDDGTDIVEIFAAFEERLADENLVKRTEVELLYAHITYVAGGYTFRVNYYLKHAADGCSSPTVEYIYCRRDFDEVSVGGTIIRETPNERSRSRFVTQEFAAGDNLTLCQINTEIPADEEVGAENIAFIKKYARDIVADILN